MTIQGSGMSPSLTYDDLGLVNPAKCEWIVYPLATDHFKVYIDRSPNAFHRLMQRLILGFRYERVKP